MTPTKAQLKVTLDAVIDQLVRSASPDDEYRSPTAQELAAADLGLARLALGELPAAAELLQTLGFTLAEGLDQGSGRRFALAVSESNGNRRWGLYLADLTGPVRLAVVVPHPRSDLRCEQLALRLWRRVPGSLLAVAAIHRKAVDTASTAPAPEKADQARNTSSVFHHHWTDVLGPRGVPQIQIHGFADSTAPEQIAVSTGVGARTPAAVRIADEIAALDLDTTRSWEGTADADISGLTNEQGKAAARSGWVWVHVEYNRSVRNTPSLWEPAVDAIAAADPTVLGQHQPSPT